MMVMHKAVKNLHKNQEAFVSIFSVLIIMAILTLVMVGFSNVTRRAQRATLDNQLNTQAYYAAESGVNDAIAYLKTNPDFRKTECQGTTGGFTYGNNLDAGLNVGYTCLLINGANDFRFSAVPITAEGAAKVFPFEATADNISTFDVTLDAVGGGAVIPTTAAAPSVLVPMNDASRPANSLGVLRADLVPISDLDRGVLARRTYTFYLVFTTTGSSGVQTVPNDTADQGRIVHAACAAAPCKTTIRLSPGSDTAYRMRLQSIYAPVSVIIDNIRNGSGGSVTISKGQPIVDVTGKAGDVLRRIQVRVPYENYGASSPLAIEAGDSICKRLIVTPGNTSTDMPADPACNL